jgi:hypothetical protein
MVCLGSLVKADCNLVATDEFPNWDYYTIDRSSQIIGYGSLECTVLNLTNGPPNLYYGYQVGIQSNNYNTDYGSGAWFNYTGTFMQNGVPSTSGGSGDVALKHDCSAVNKQFLTYNYTALDICGNTRAAQQLLVLCHDQTSFLSNLPLKNKQVNFCDLEAIEQAVIWNSPCTYYTALPGEKDSFCHK